jgi:hypothetical protein
MHNSNAGDAQLVILVIGTVLVVAGFLWIRRITAGEGEGVSAWRYHETEDRRDTIIESAIRDIYLAPPTPPEPTLEERANMAFAESYSRARRGRSIAKLIFTIGYSPVVFFVLFVVAAPMTWGGGSGAASPRVMGVYAFGAAGVVIGLIWMWRILRADPEAGAPPWRHRDF